jgi:hypothetical protein
MRGPRTMDRCCTFPFLAWIRCSRMHDGLSCIASCIVSRSNAVLVRATIDCRTNRSTNEPSIRRRQRECSIYYAQERMGADMDVWMVDVEGCNRCGYVRTALPPLSTAFGLAQTLCWLSVVGVLVLGVGKKDAAYSLVASLFGLLTTVPTSPCLSILPHFTRRRQSRLGRTTTSVRSVWYCRSIMNDSL